MKFNSRKAQIKISRNITKYEGSSSKGCQKLKQSSHETQKKITWNWNKANRKVMQSSLESWNWRVSRNLNNTSENCSKNFFKLGKAHRKFKQILIEIKMRLTGTFNKSQWNSEKKSLEIGKRIKFLFKTNEKKIAFW